MANKYIKKGSFEREMKAMKRPLTKPKAPSVSAEFKRVTGIALTKTPKPKPFNV
jgi:hypothetical protein